MTVLTGTARAALLSNRPAHLSTINPDGSPQISLVWVGVEADQIVIGHLGDGVKVRNIARDPRVALSLEAEGSNEMGLLNYLIVYGNATLREGGAPALLQRLALRYLGPNVKFPPFENPPDGHVIVISPQRLGGVGPWRG